jgi:excisionase family DNA binding protein
MAPRHHCSPKDFATAVGVSESTIKRWADEGRFRVQRTAGGHRRIPVAEALRFVRNQGLEIQRGDVLGLPTASSEPGDNAEAKILDLLIEGDCDGFESWMVERYSAGSSLAACFDGPVRAAFSHIGDLWETQGDGIMIEHRAVDCCLRALSRIRSLIPPPKKKAPKAVGAAPTGDPYLLPSAMVATVLADRGWNVVNLGPDTPVETLGIAVNDLKAELLWLACSAPPAMGLAAGVAKLAPTLVETGTHLLLGGRTIPALSAELADNGIDADQHPGLIMAESMGVAEHWGQTLVEQRKSDRA